MTDVFSKKLWEREYTKILTKRIVNPGLGEVLSQPGQERIDGGDANAWAKGYTLFKVNGDEYASYERADAVANALLAFGQKVTFVGWSMQSRSWVCFILSGMRF